MPPEHLWSIGELAERAGVTVKAVRFYSDSGLLPEAHRSAGGHRRYGPGALERLRTIRSLRALGLAVPSVARVLREDEDAGGGGPLAAGRGPATGTAERASAAVPESGGLAAPGGGPPVAVPALAPAAGARVPLGPALEDAVVARLRETGAQLAALRWQETALRLLHECPAGERAERLRLLGAVCGTSAPPSTAAMARFWRRWLPPRMPQRTVALVLDVAVPQPPADPTPEQVLAFAELHAFVSRDCSGTGGSGQPAAHRGDARLRPGVLYEGLGEAYELAAPHLRAGRAPHAGEALDCFVAAYAVSQRMRDTPAFRRRLGGVLAADPRIDRYWDLVARITGPAHPTPGAAHAWLAGALA